MSRRTTQTIPQARQLAVLMRRQRLLVINNRHRRCLFHHLQDVELGETISHSSDGCHISHSHSSGGARYYTVTSEWSGQCREG